MCQPASGIVTRTQVLWDIEPGARYGGDSHEAIIARYHLGDKGDPNFVRIELRPPDDDYTRPVEEWRLYVDQDFTPDWWDAREAEIAVRAALPRWWRTHVVSEGKHECGEGHSLIVLGGQVRVIGGKAYLRGASQSHGQTGGEAELTDNSQSHGQTGGKAYLRGASQSHGQTGGKAWLYDDSQSHGQTGGIVVLMSEDAQSVDRRAGILVPCDG